MQFPQIIDIETAVSHIKQACDESNGGRLPFFFLVGGGLSYPSVPLASEIIEQCKEIAKKYKRNSEPVRDMLIDKYEHWLKQAYPQSKQRQTYLRNLIEKKPISPANFRLAHLLLDKKITNLVVTTNFDDFLSRALMLFGKQPIICDHPKTVNRIDPEQNDDLQIVHVHGTYWFYDCCNLRGEIETRAQASPHTTQTMASLLDRILSSHSPLVIGYGGWEDDVFMTALKRRLQSPLPYNLYWFCYRRSEIDALPDELKFNPQVYFVSPPMPQPDPDASDIAYQGGKIQKLAPAAMQAKSLSDKEKEPLTLSAKDVLDRLIQTFALEAPELTKDPLGFFAEHLHRSLRHGSNEDDKSDIYLIGSVIDKIKRAKALEEKAVQIVETELENIRDAFRSLKYREVIKLSSGIYKDNLTDTHLRELMDFIWTAALELGDNSNEELDGYDLVIKIGDRLNTREPALLENVAKALVNKGVTLGSLNRSEEAIAVYDDVVKRFGNAKEPALLERVAKALFNKGFTLGSL
ncbi:MAG: SIR2 family protein, partial [Deltaproteobacteria bacterium]|nr:SIR2 family protein [Deltaproteobacteria bacterium]